MNQTLDEGRIVLCTVDRIVGTIVFVKIDDYGLEGTITFSEISPGRIRNIRDFVFPGKKIVCKILRIKDTGIDLSLRRVKLKEKNELNEQYKREKSYTEMFKSILGEKSSKALDKIREKEESLVSFLEKIKKDKTILNEYLSNEDAEKISKILEDKKTKEVSLLKRFSVINRKQSGIVIVKSLIREASKGTNAEVSYIAAGKYLIKMKSTDAKKADNLLENVLKNIETASKKQGCIFSVEKS
jgi:translation initiation factor 2 alpha subunit (eIF-2alpha)